MSDVWIKKIGDHRGSPRVYLDGPQALRAAVRAGFVPGEKFDVEIDGNKVVLALNKDGSRIVSAKRSKRAGEADLPVIDINSKELLAVFDGMDSVRVVVGDDRVYLLPLASEVKKVERFARLKRKVEAGEPLAMGSLAHGGGVLTHAIHQGLKDAGVATELKFANEIRDDLVAQALTVNDAWINSDPSNSSVRGAGRTDRTRALAVPMQEMVQDDWLMSSLPLLEGLELGLPCSGATRAGISKGKLSKMEDHEQVGHLMFSALVILNKTQPAFVLLENVPLYATSASAQILRHQLRDMGYTCHEAILEGRDFGAMENRVRWCMVATTKGIDFDFDRLGPAVRVVRELAEILDPSIGSDDARWGEYAYLKAKAARDKTDGKGFKNQVVTPASTSVPTLRKGYHKVGTTDPLLEHPTDPNLFRKFTAEEHARVKGVPEHLISGLSETIAHELLGQGIAYEPFRAVAERIGDAVRAAVMQGRQQLAEAEETECSAVSNRRARMTG